MPPARTGACAMDARTGMNGLNFRYVSVNVSKVSQHPRTSKKKQEHLSLDVKKSCNMVDLVSFVQEQAKNSFTYVGLSFSSTCIWFCARLCT